METGLQIEGFAPSPDLDKGKTFALLSVSGYSLFNMNRL